ncbi:MAG TPA: T9SS type A sorting domain-containing protein, partial [Puia sp.]|nr:T9SS type A sorting domain-containing protein [Puia sp.]
IILPTSSTKLDGTNSFDPDGTITSYYWSQVSGPSNAVITSGNTATPTVSNLVVGQYVFELTVTDNSSASGKDRVNITVNNPVTSNPGQPPVANAGQDTTITLPSNSVTLDGSGSMAPNGSITTYQWTEVSGPNSASFSSFSSSVSSAGDLVVGDYVFQLTITDNTGATSTATVRVKVVDNLKSNESISLYPNPAHDMVHLRLISDSTGTVRVNLYDLNGRLVHAEEMSKPASFMDNTLNIARLAGGMYTVQAVIGNNKVLVAKLIKQ